ncbi:MAG: RagB/SusD family nutrient uptake outer membrane protein [Bacteroidales bacterium]|nr:RagB/SusD family nutrient uptake outer membrane protein [Bacteroidales bacterium]
MKKSIFLSIFITFLMFSCSDANFFGNNFLDVPNPNKLTSEDFYKSPADAWSGVVAIYNTLLLEGTYREWFIIENETRSDLGIMTLNWWPDWEQYCQFIISNYGWCYETWGDNFKGIQKANKVLKYVPDINMDNDIKNRYISEAYFFRALFYYNIVIIYGRPPLMLIPSIDGQEKPTNATPDEIYDQCISDLNSAIPNLPWDVSTNETGRVRKAAAYAQLGKMYLLKHDYLKAKDAFFAIIDSKKYGLVDDFTDNFTDKNEYNKESIFEITFSNQNNTSFAARYTSTQATGERSAEDFAPLTVGGNSDVRPSAFFMNEFTDLTVDGKHDPRKLMTLLCDTSQVWYGKSFKILGGSTDTIGGKIPEIWYKKYTNGYHQTKEDENSPINRRIIRYADVLLMYAECLNELGQTQEAYKYIDMVRARHSVNVVPLTIAKPSLTQDQMRLQIEHERIVELGGEGQRWFDLLRWGYLDDPNKVDILRKRDYEFNKKPFRPSLDKYKPIIQTEIDLDPNLTQNPGW